MKKEAESRKADLKLVFEKRTSTFGTLDYVAGWFMKAVDYGKQTKTATALVTTNSICQGQQVPILWPLILAGGYEIEFAHTSFKWKNLASKNAGVTVVIIGLSNQASKRRRLFVAEKEGALTVKDVENINPYLIPAKNVIIAPRSAPISGLAEMSFGSMPNDGGHLLMNLDDATSAIKQHEVQPKFIRPALGTKEFINGIERRCVWVGQADYEDASANIWIKARFESVQEKRHSSDRAATKKLGDAPYRFGEIRQTGDEDVMIVAKTSSEQRDYLPIAIFPRGAIVTEAFAFYDAPRWCMALIASRLHLVWVATICGKMKTDYRYSNTLGWNTFPVPLLTEQNKADLTACAEAILLAREAHFPATIADLYDPETMPDNLRRAHECNDEVLERIYIGRRFRNDTERLEKLFDLYTRMTADTAKAAPKKPRGKKA